MELGRDCLEKEELNSKLEKQQKSHLEVLVEVVADGEGGKDGVVDEGATKIGEGAGGMLALVGAEVPRDQEVEYRVAEKLQTLITI